MSLPETLLLGLDIGGTKCAVILGTAGGEILERIEWPAEAWRGPDAMPSDPVHHAKRMNGAAKIGVSIGGPLTTREGMIHSPPNLPGWDDFPLRTRLQEACDLPVNVEHDAVACAYAEYLWGAGSAAENLAYLKCGTGFGSGFVFGGKIHRGAYGGSCEVGHIGLRPDGPTAYGKRGNAESYGSGTALFLLAAWRFPERWGSNPSKGEKIARLAAVEDAEARKIVSICADAVGEVAAILADTLGLDCVLLGSLARYSVGPWLRQVRAGFSAWVLPMIGDRCRIEAAGLGDRLRDCSALVAALSR